MLGQGEGDFRDHKRKSWWMQRERKQKRKKIHTSLRNAMQDRGTVAAPPRRRVEEDEYEAPAALQRESAQGGRGLRWVQARF